MAIHHSVKKLKSALTDSKGYTIIELLIAIQLAFLVISLVYVSYLFAIRLLNQWQERTDLEIKMASMSQVLSNIFHETDQILIAEKERLVLVTSKNDTIVFVFNNGTFLINNMSTFPNNRIKLFQFNYFMGNNSFNENTWFER